MSFGVQMHHVSLCAASAHAMSHHEQSAELAVKRLFYQMCLETQ